MPSPLSQPSARPASKVLPLSVSGWKIILNHLRGREKENLRWLGVGEVGYREHWDSDDALFLDLGDGYTGVFTLPLFIQLNDWDGCTFLYAHYTSAF